MAETVIEVCNSALMKLGAQSILSLADNTTEARACNLRITPCRRVVLRRHPWNFATARIITAPIVGEPPFEFAYSHQLPATCLRVLAIGPNDIGYRIEGRNILTDSDTVELKYINDITDPTIWDQLFGEALACYLAWDLSYKITQKEGVRRELWDAYLLALRDARSVDAQEERDHELTADLFIESRVSAVTPGRSNR